jgi:hypothetical protein
MRFNAIDITTLTSDIRTIVAVAFFVVCVVVMHKMFWMLEQFIPANQEATAKARARRWKGIVAGTVIGAWICAVVIILTFNMPDALDAIVLAGPIVISLPVLVWVFLIY